MQAKNNPFNLYPALILLAPAFVVRILQRIQPTLLAENAGAAFLQNNYSPALQEAEA